MKFRMEGELKGCHKPSSNQVNRSIYIWLRSRHFRVIRDSSNLQTCRPVFFFPEVSINLYSYYTWMSKALWDEIVSRISYRTRNWRGHFAQVWFWQSVCKNSGISLIRLHWFPRHCSLAAFWARLLLDELSNKRFRVTLVPWDLPTWSFEE